MDRNEDGEEEEEEEEQEEEEEEEKNKHNVPEIDIRQWVWQLTIWLVSDLPLLPNAVTEIFLLKRFFTGDSLILAGVCGLACHSINQHKGDNTCFRPAV